MIEAFTVTACRRWRELQVTTQPKTKWIGGANEVQSQLSQPIIHQFCQHSSETQEQLPFPFSFDFLNVMSRTPGSGPLCHDCRQNSLHVHQSVNSAGAEFSD